MNIFSGFMEIIIAVVTIIVGIIWLTIPFTLWRIERQMEILINLTRQNASPPEEDRTESPIPHVRTPVPKIHQPVPRIRSA